MTEQIAGQTGSKPRQTGNDPSGAKKNGKRERRVYEHEMSAGERFALRQILGAKNALTALAIAVQEGRGVTPEIVKSCSQIVQDSADILF
jgi:hypothetical protein